MNFTDLGLAEPLLRAVHDQGYDIPTPIQAQAIPQVLKGGDLLAGAQTGTGKTAGFVLPMLHRLMAVPSKKDARGRVAIRCLRLCRHSKSPRRSPPVPVKHLALRKPGIPASVLLPPARCWAGTPACPSTRPMPTAR